MKNSFARKNLKSFGGQQIEHEPALCPDSKGGHQQHPGLYHQERSQQIKWRDCQLLPGIC